MFAPVSADRGTAEHFVTAVRGCFIVRLQPPRDTQLGEEGERDDDSVAELAVPDRGLE